jgi:hypothetical protein
MQSKLQGIIKKQMKSLFIGSVINETSLEDYALTKELTSYQGGYETHILCIMQRNMDIVKYDFPQLYAKYRTELISQIQGKREHDIFMVCDKYIKSFFSIRIFSHAEISNIFQQFENFNHGIHIASIQKLAKIKKIIKDNLFSIFTSFALDLEINVKENNLQKYVELKEVLNIKEGIGREDAINYDKFKQFDKKRYKKLIDKLDDRMIALRNSRNAPFYMKKGLSAYMFMSAVYLTHCHSISVNMSKEEYTQMLDGIADYEFFSG